MTLAGLAVAVIHNRKAVEYWEFADLPGLMGQLDGSEGDGSG